MTDIRRLDAVVQEAQAGFASGETDPNGVLQVRMNCVDTDGALDVSRGRRVPRPANIAKYSLQPGDILFNNTNSPDLVGKTAFFAGASEPIAFSNHFTRIRVDPSQASSRYVARWLTMMRNRGDLRLLSNQWVNQALIPIDALLQLKIPLPDLPRQNGIADLLDKADSIRRKRKQAIALTDDLLRSIFLDMFGDPVSNPKAWPEALIGDVLSNIESGWSPVCQPRPAAVDEWGVLKLGAVTFGEYDDGQNKAFVTGVEPERRHEVKVGDVLFARKNTYEHVAACVLVTATRPRLVLPDLLFRLAPKPGLLPAFLWGVMSDHSKRKQVQAIAGGTAGSMPNISKERLRGIKIPVPPGALQQKFSRFVEKQTRAIRHIHSALALADQMSATLSQRAFGGSAE